MMPDKKADSSSTMAEDHGHHKDADEAPAEPEFAEMDQTGRYGRVSPSVLLNAI